VPFSLTCRPRSQFTSCSKGGQCGHGAVGGLRDGARGPVSPGIFHAGRGRSPGAAARFALETGLRSVLDIPWSKAENEGGRENRVGVYMATVQGQKRRAKPDDACLRRRLLSVRSSRGAAEPAPGRALLPSIWPVAHGLRRGLFACRSGAAGPRCHGKKGRKGGHAVKRVPSDARTVLLAGHSTKRGLPGQGAVSEV
jgi:hypothetical protein